MNVAFAAAAAGRMVFCMNDWHKRKKKQQQQHWGAGGRETHLHNGTANWTKVLLFFRQFARSRLAASCCHCRALRGRRRGRRRRRRRFQITKKRTDETRRRRGGGTLLVIHTHSHLLHVQRRVFEGVVLLCLFSSPSPRVIYDVTMLLLLAVR